MLVLMWWALQLVLAVSAVWIVNRWLAHKSHQQMPTEELYTDGGRRKSKRSDDHTTSWQPAMALQRSETETCPGFVILTYNVLADCCTRPSWFPYASAASLDWTQRSLKIKTLLLQEKAELLCLQEVQSTSSDVGKEEEAAQHHAKWFEDWLSQAGYECRYGRKQALEQDAEGHWVTKELFGVHLGNLTAWKNDAFEFISHELVSLPQEVQNRGRFPSSSLFRDALQVSQPHTQSPPTHFNPIPLVTHPFPHVKLRYR